jgi:hypothetical protein
LERFDVKPEKMFGTHGRVNNGVFHIFNDNLFSNFEVFGFEPVKTKLENLFSENRLI